MYTGHYCQGCCKKARKNCPAADNSMRSGRCDPAVPSSQNPQQSRMLNRSGGPEALLGTNKSGHSRPAYLSCPLPQDKDEHAQYKAGHGITQVPQSRHSHRDPRYRTDRTYENGAKARKRHHHSIFRRVKGKNDKEYAHPDISSGHHSNGVLHHRGIAKEFCTKEYDDGFECRNGQEHSNYRQQAQNTGYPQTNL
jgi:hypothetical protein